MTLPNPSAAAVLAVSAGLNPEDPTSLQAIVTRLASKGYAISVMDHGGQPSDHKVWWQGAAWTFISSDGYKPGTYRWDPYQQVAYDGGGFNTCGIPLSAKADCPSWARMNTPAPPPPPPPATPPTADPSLQDLVDALSAIEDQIAEILLTVRMLGNKPAPIYRTTIDPLNIPVVLRPDPPQESQS